MLYHTKEKTIYKIIDQFNCIYYIIKLPSFTEKQALIIGPYIRIAFDKERLLQYVESYKLSPQTFHTLQKIFAQIPLLSEDISVQTFIQTFGEILWKNKDGFEIELLEETFDANTYPNTIPADNADKSINLNMYLLDQYLEKENTLLQAVIQGQTLKAEDILSTMNVFKVLDPSSNTLLNTKNYAITLNTLLRKTAEYSTKNPILVSTLYFQILNKIEQATTPESYSVLFNEMVRKYSTLVKSNSTKQYSILVQQVMNLTDIDLSADLRLHIVASKLNVNASYLSTHFKAVTGTSYTSYINRKRIEHSIYLLNSTNLQIQTIAQHCGFSDLNYFTKLFKKYVHCTPSAYRKENTLS